MVDKIFINVAYEWLLACEWRMEDCCSRHLLTVFSGVWQRSLRAEHSMVTTRKNISVLAKHFSVQLFCNHSVRTFCHLSSLQWIVDWSFLLAVRHILWIQPCRIRDQTPSGAHSINSSLFLVFLVESQIIKDKDFSRFKIIMQVPVPVAWFLAGVQPWH